MFRAPRALVLVVECVVLVSLLCAPLRVDLVEARAKHRKDPTATPTVSCVAGTPGCNPSGTFDADLVVDLPGLSASDAAARRMWSGLIPLNDSHAGTATPKTQRSVFYWLVESDKGLANAPIVLWTNGGPGCSGLLGFFSELGPFFPNAAGNLISNPYAWTTVASVVFVEIPVGVGFSKPGKQRDFSDASTATDSYALILEFFKRFPALKKQNFYLASESYGGHYLPQLSAVIVSKGLANFRGLLVGNPVILTQARDIGEFLTFAGHALLPKPLIDSFAATNCMTNTGDDACQRILGRARLLTINLDPYGLDFVSEMCPGV